MIKKLKNIDRFHVLVFIIMLFSALFLLFLTTQKEGMHVDEYLTYSDANREVGGNNTVHPEYGVRVSTADVYDPYLYADSFNLRNIYLNMQRGTHPPLYYILINTLCYITNNFLALKTGVLLNIIIHVIDIGLVWLIMEEMLSSKYEALAGTAFFAFLPVILGNVLFVRMYILSGTFTLGLTLLFVKEWGKAGGKTFYIKLGILSVGGALTHYYFLVYLFYSCMVWGIYIISKRRWKELAIFLGTMTASGIVSISIFPSMIKHIFIRGRGKESFSSAVTFSSVFHNNIKSYATAINRLYGGFLVAVILMAAAWFVFRFVIGNREKGSWAWANKWVIVFFPCILDLLTITKVSPLTTPRYIAPVYGVCVILLMGLFDNIISFVTEREYIKWIAGVLFCGILLNNSYNTYTWPELYSAAEACVAEARQYGVNNECIYVLSYTWRSYPSYQEFIQYQNMTFIPQDRLDLLYTSEYAGYDHVVMYFDKDMSQEDIDGILMNMIDMNPDLERYEKLHEYSYNVTYYLE